MFEVVKSTKSVEILHDFPIPSSLSEFEAALPQLPKEDIVADRPDFGFRMIVRVAPGVVAKFVPEGVSEEVLCMRLAATLPIPVPRVLWCPGNPEIRVWEDGDALNHPDWVWCIYMDEVPGVPLYKVLDSLSNDNLRALGAQLRAIVDHIASIKSPTGAIAAMDGGPLRTFIAPSWVQPQEAFPTNDAFVAWLTDLFARCDIPRKITRTHAEEQLAHLAGPAEVRFTHGDLVPKNIMVSPDGARVTGIVYWGNAGFYPDYWERAQMHDSGHMLELPAWKTVLEVAWPEADPRPMAQWVVHEVLDAVSLMY